MISLKRSLRDQDMAVINSNKVTLLRIDFESVLPQPAVLPLLRSECFYRTISASVFCVQERWGCL